MGCMNDPYIIIASTLDVCSIYSHASKNASSNQFTSLR